MLSGEELTRRTMFEFPACAIGAILSLLESSDSLPSELSGTDQETPFNPTLPISRECNDVTAHNTVAIIRDTISTCFHCKLRRCERYPRLDCKLRSGWTSTGPEQRRPR